MMIFKLLRLNLIIIYKYKCNYQLFSQFYPQYNNLHQYSIKVKTQFVAWKGSVIFVIAISASHFEYLSQACQNTQREIIKQNFCLLINQYFFFNFNKASSKSHQKSNTINQQLKCFIGKDINELIVLIKNKLGIGNDKKDHYRQNAEKINNTKQTANMQQTCNKSRFDYFLISGTVQDIKELQDQILEKFIEFVQPIDIIFLIKNAVLIFATEQYAQAPLSSFRFIAGDQIHRYSLFVFGL